MLTMIGIFDSKPYKNNNFLLGIRLLTGSLRFYSFCKLSIYNSFLCVCWGGGVLFALLFLSEVSEEESTFLVSAV